MKKTILRQKLIKCKTDDLIGNINGHRSDIIFDLKRDGITDAVVLDIKTEKVGWKKYLVTFKIEFTMPAPRPQQKVRLKKREDICGMKAKALIIDEYEKSIKSILKGKPTSIVVQVHHH